MIQRHYFYIVGNASKSVHGCLTLRTWAAQPQQALDAAIENAAVLLQVPRENLSVELFNRV
jgi:hypothetical protein